MKHLFVALALIALPCVAQEKPKAGFVGHKDCRVYFDSYSEFYYFLPDPPLTTLARMTDAEKEQWRKNSVIYRKADDLTPGEENWWSRKDHKKFPGLCYVPHSYLNDPKHAAFSGPLFGVYLSGTHSSHVEKGTASETSTQDVPVHGQATVYDNSGQNIGTATVSGTARVETTTTYPVDVRIYGDRVEAAVWRLTDVGGPPGRIFATYKSRRRGDAGIIGVAEAFRHDPRENALHECLKFLMVETGLKR